MNHSGRMRTADPELKLDAAQFSIAGGKQPEWYP